MGITRPAIPFTYEDYRTLAQSTDERHELIDGDLYMVPSPTVTHQAVLMNLVLQLGRHMSAAGCGRIFCAPLDVVLGEGAQRSVVQPDILFISNDRHGIVAENEIVGAPDLVIEILSKGTANRDTGVKKALYARSGVREYWIVDPKAKSIELFSLGPDGYDPTAPYDLGERLVSTVVPGFELALTGLFERT